MSEMTYTKCSLCHGTLIPKMKELLRCPCAESKTPGWDKTGITVGQIERAVRAENCLREIMGLAARALPG